MQYNNHVTGQDIISQISFLTDANLADYVIADRTRNANFAYHRAVTLMQHADGRFQFDDANNTTLPIATTGLVSGQSDYGLAAYMSWIYRVEAKDTSGTWSVLYSVDPSDIHVALDEYESTDGSPVKYDKHGRTLVLYPTPNYTQAASLKVYFKRPANIFDTTDTTKEPGFDEMFHEYIPTYAALVYCELYKPKRVPMLRERLFEMEKNITKFYGRRSKDEKPILQAAIISCE